MNGNSRQTLPADTSSACVALIAVWHSWAAHAGLRRGRRGDRPRRRAAAGRRRRGGLRRGRARRARRHAPRAPSPGDRVAVLRMADLDRVPDESTPGRDPWRFVDPPPPAAAAAARADRGGAEAQQRGRGGGAPARRGGRARWRRIEAAKPKPPEFTLQYLGRFGPPDKQIAVFTNGKQTINKQEGEVIDNKFIVAHIGYESVDIGFVGFPDRAREACRRDSPPPRPSRRKPWMMRDLTVRLSVPLLAARDPGRLHQSLQLSAGRDRLPARQVGRGRAGLHEGGGRRPRPTSRYQAALLRAKIKASQEHFEKGKEFEKAGVIERALVEYQQAVQLDPTNQYAQAQLEHVHRQYVAAEAGARRRDHRADEAEGARRPPAAAGAQPALGQADLAGVPAAGVAVLDLPRPRQGVRDQHPVRSQPARPGDRDRPQGRHRPGGARDADARRRPLLQGDGRALDHHRRRTRRRTAAPTRTSSSRRSSSRTPR